MQFYTVGQRVRVKANLLNGGTGGVVVGKKRESHGTTNTAVYTVRLDDGRTRDFFSGMLEPLTQERGEARK